MVGKTIKLEGLTALGKNRIREKGDTWRVGCAQDSVPCLGGVAGLFLTPVRRRKPSRRHPAAWDSRWIAATGDKDFRIVEG